MEICEANFSTPIKPPKCSTLTRDEHDELKFVVHPYKDGSETRKQSKLRGIYYVG